LVCFSFVWGSDFSELSCTSRMESIAFDDMAFRACAICRRSCFERHGNDTHEAALGSPSFLKLLGDDDICNSLSSLVT
jgi:hypothetical protein